MTHLPLDAPITRREFYFEMLTVWLFILLVATKAVGSDASWRNMVVPVGALAILALHAVALWRGSRRERASRGGAA